MFKKGEIFMRLNINSIKREQHIAFISSVSKNGTYFIYGSSLSFFKKILIYGANS
jgi:hypothetical protein